MQASATELSEACSQLVASFVNSLHGFIRIMEGLDMLGLIYSWDAYLLLHKADGFVGTIAEALLLNKSVLITGYWKYIDLIPKL